MPAATSMRLPLHPEEHPEQLLQFLAADDVDVLNPDIGPPHRQGADIAHKLALQAARLQAAVCLAGRLKIHLGSSQIRPPGITEEPEIVISIDVEADWHDFVILSFLLAEPSEDFIPWRNHLAGLTGADAGGMVDERALAKMWRLQASRGAKVPSLRI